MFDVSRFTINEAVQFGLSSNEHHVLQKATSSHPTKQHPNPNTSNHNQSICPRRKKSTRWKTESDLPGAVVVMFDNRKQNTGIFKLYVRNHGQKETQGDLRGLKRVISFFRKPVIG